MMTDLRSTASRAIQVHAGDNVATMLQDTQAGPVLIHGHGAEGQVQARESIAMGHKIALETVPAGAPIIKYGVPIGLSTASIQSGEWVHLHNIRSQVDSRSSSLDVVTGATKDTPYA